MLSTPDRERKSLRTRRRWHALETGDIDATSWRSAELSTSDTTVQAANTVGYAPRWWVPSSYFAEGVPFAIVIWVAGTMFKDLGHSDAEITIATATIGHRLRPISRTNATPPQADQPDKAHRF